MSPNHLAMNNLNPFHGDYLRRLSQQPERQRLEEQVHHEYMSLYAPVLMNQESNQRTMEDVLTYHQRLARTLELQNHLARNQSHYLQQHRHPSFPQPFKQQPDRNNSFYPNLQQHRHPSLPQPLKLQPEEVPSYCKGNAILPRGNTLPSLSSQSMPSIALTRNISPDVTPDSKMLARAIEVIRGELGLPMGDPDEHKHTSRLEATRREIQQQHAINANSSKEDTHRTTDNEEERNERKHPGEHTSKEKAAIEDYTKQIQAIEKKRASIGESERKKPPSDGDSMNCVSDSDEVKNKSATGLRHLQWENHFQRLVEYKEKNGHTMVPTNYPDDIQLGNWVRNQRLNFKNRGITDERKRKLNEIGFMWVFYDRSTTRWDEMFNRLKIYLENNGDVNVPLRYSNDTQLGAWVNYQRTTHRQGKLTAEKVAKLTSVDFEWNPMKHAATWEHMFWRLMAYKNASGNTRVPFRYKADPQLGYWVSNQRAFYRKKRLSKERQILLESVGLFPRQKLRASSEEVAARQAVELVKAADEAFGK